MTFNDNFGPIFLRISLLYSLPDMSNQFFINPFILKFEFAIYFRF